MLLPVAERVQGRLCEQDARPGPRCSVQLQHVLKGVVPDLEHAVPVLDLPVADRIADV